MTGRVAVFGASPIGLGVVAGATASGVGVVYVSEPRRARREAARQLGADAVIDPTATDPRDRILSDGRVDVSFECAGTVGTVTDAPRRTEYGGRTVLLSVFTEAIPIHPRDVVQAER